MFHILAYCYSTIKTTGKYERLWEIQYTYIPYYKTFLIIKFNQTANEM